MKITILTVSQYRGGAEEYALKIARGAVDDGHSVQFAFPNTEGTLSLQHDIQNLGYDYEPINIGVDDVAWMEYRKIVPLCRTFLRTRRFLKKNKPDAVIITQPSLRCSMGAILACAVSKVSTMVVFQLVSSIFKLKDIEIVLYRWARKQQPWIAISQNNRELASASFQCSTDDFYVIYNGVQVPTPLPEEERKKNRNRIRQELGIEDHTPVLLTIGRLHVQKGLTYLAEGLPGILEKYPTAQCLWAGDGPEKENLQDQLRSNNTLESVHFLGHRTDITDLLMAADLFVFPTLWEGGQSFALAEAMAVNLPVVTTDASGIPEVITNKVHGLISPKKDAPAFTESVIYALDHQEEMHHMAQNAYERVKEFSEPIMVNQTLQILHKLTDRKP